MTHAPFSPTREPVCPPPCGMAPSERTRAIAELADAFAREPELILAFLQGVEHETPDRVAIILAAAQTAATACPDYADLLYYVGQAAVAARDYAAAAAALQRAVELNPGYNDALILAARVALHQDQPSRAVELLERAVSQGADYPDVHVLLGRAWDALGERDRACAACARACELNPSLTAARTALTDLPPTDMSGKSDELPA